MIRNSFVIVHADHDQQARCVLASFLYGKGFTVHECSNGWEALELCRTVRPGALLMDLDMPVLDGYDTARRVRADTELSHIVLIAITSRTDEYASARAWEVGFNEFLSKPIHLSTVLQVVRRTQEMAAVRPRQ